MPPVLVLGAWDWAILSLTLIRQPDGASEGGRGWPGSSFSVSRCRSASPAWSWFRRPGWAGSIEPRRSPGWSRSRGLPTRLRLSSSRDGPVEAARPLRILVIGESSALGEPYQPCLSVGQIVAWQLERVLPGRRVQVDMWAECGAILEGMHQKLAG